MTDSDPRMKMAGFMANLRDNGFAAGPAEAATALQLLAEDDLLQAGSARLALKVLLADGRDQWQRFDRLFDAYWLGRGVKRLAPAEDSRSSRAERRNLPIWDRHLNAVEALSADRAEGFGADDGEAEGEGSGRLLASRREALGRIDLRRLVRPEEIAEAADLAARLAAAMRYRLSRRRRTARRGDQLDLRRTIRRNLSRGGEPLDLVLRRRPQRPVRLILLLDVSGSMRAYSRVFLSFLRGLIGRWAESDAYLFHTRLVRITEALRDGDALRAFTRLSLLAEGFGGGTGIARSLAAFNDAYAKTAINSRSIVFIVSDGYDTDPPEQLVDELVRLKRRARRLVWLNPLLGSPDYAPVARGMAASLPHIDLLAPAHNLASLAALEDELAAL